MKKKEILAVKKNFRRFKQDLKATQKIQRQLDEYLLLYNEYISLFTARLAETESLFDSYITPGDNTQLMNATKQMQETQMSFNLQYLQLQSQMQHENRSYTAISNIMKTKHDTVKNSISNIR
jgi:hypothetical protein